MPRAMMGGRKPPPTTWVGRSDEHSDGGSDARTRIRRHALGSVDFRHHLHGVYRQPAIRLDAIRQSDRSEISLGPCGDSGRLHHLRPDRNLAGADRGLSHRQIRPAHHDQHERCADCGRLDAERLCGLALPALSGSCHRRHRRRRHLRRLGRQRAQVVS